MARQLIFLGIGLLLVIAHWVEFLPLGWMIALLLVLFFLWLPLRGQVELAIDEEIAATAYLMPLPFWKIRVFGITRPYHWWKTLGEDVERIQQKQRDTGNAQQQPKEAQATAAECPAVEAEDDPVVGKDATAEAETSSRIDAQLLAKALHQVSIQRLQCHLTLGGPPFAAALAGGSIQMVIGWVATVLSAHAQHFPEPDVTINLDPDGPWVQGQGMVRLKTDLAGAITMGITFLAERRRKQNGRKSD